MQSEKNDLCENTPTYVKENRGSAKRTVTLLTLLSWYQKAIDTETDYCIF